MFKPSVTLLAIISLLIATIPVPSAAQTVESSATPASSTTAESKMPDYRQIFAEETKKFNTKSAEFDPMKIEKEQMRQQKTKKWDKKQTALVVAVAVGIAALVFLVVKYGKNCIRTTPENCSLATDENCYCEEYERRNP